MHTHRYKHTNTCICSDIINKKVASQSPRMATERQTVFPRMAEKTKQSIETGKQRHLDEEGKIYISYKEIEEHDYVLGKKRQSNHQTAYV